MWLTPHMYLLYCKIVWLLGEFARLVSFWLSLKNSCVMSEQHQNLSLVFPLHHSDGPTPTSKQYAVLGVILLLWQNLRVVSCYASGSAEMGSSRQQLFGQRNSGVEVVNIKRITLFKPFYHRRHDSTFSMAKAWHWVIFDTMHQHVPCIFTWLAGVSNSNCSKVCMRPCTVTQVPQHPNFVTMIKLTK